MNHYSRASQRRLETCHEDIIIVMEDALQVMDNTILYGSRGEIMQNMMFDRGLSQLMFPLSKHNRVRSEAVDACPYPVDWEDLYRFHELNGVIQGVAFERGIRIAWGGKWKTFKDYCHWELEL